jgi:hypothetical protein
MTKLNFARPKNLQRYDECFGAFTGDELGEILFKINYFNLEKTGYLNITTEMVDRYKGYFYRLTNTFSENIIDDYKEADARARLLIYLLENKLMELPNEP